MAQRSQGTDRYSANLIWVLLIVLFALAGCSPPEEAPRAVKGVLDLSAWDFQRKGAAKLYGEWEFYWQNLEAPAVTNFAEGQRAKDYYPLPGVWQGQTAMGASLSSTGFATYRLRVQLPDNSPDSLSLLVSGGMSVWQVWVNGKKEVASGILGQSKDSEKPQRHFVIAYSFPTKPYLDIVLQVSNFHNLQGGINGDVRLGTTPQIDNFYTIPRVLGAFMGGALLCISLVYLVLYCVRRQSKENLYFGLFCLAWCEAILFSPSCGFLMTTLAPSLSWEWYITLSMLPYGVTVPLMLMFYHSLFPKKYGAITQGVYWVLGLLYMGYILATPANAYDPVLFGYFVLTSTAFIYLFMGFFIDLVRRERGVIMLVAGYLALGLAEFNDILFDLNIVSSVDFRPVGVFIFILSYAFFLSVRFSLAFSRAETLSEELKERNVQLMHFNTLKRELALRQKTERDLRFMQSRLSKILDSLDDAIIAVNPSREIAFCNQPFEALTGYQANSLLGRPFTDLLEKPEELHSKNLLEDAANSDQPGVFEAVSLGKADGENCSVSLFVTDIEIEDELLQLIIVRPTGAVDNTKTSSISTVMLQDLNNNRQRILNLEETMLSLESGDLQGQQEIMDDLKALDNLLENLGKRVTVTEKSGDKRQAAVKVMQFAVDYWEAATGTTRAELAELSGLWNVYMEKDGYFRTQTLDKYLAEETLPLKPRWKKIHITADFVLTNCETDLPERQDLEAAFAHMKDFS